ncbi:MAG: PilZ domain-containing protein [Acidobacteriota bacterium]
MFDRRNSVRHILHWQIDIDGRDSFGRLFHESCVMEDLSSTGAFFYLNHKVEVGTEVSLAIKLPTTLATHMRYTAKVVRIEERSATEEIAMRVADMPQRFGIGVRFDSHKPVFVDG